MSTQPLNSAPPQGPVEGRGAAEIRALCDAATPGPWEVRTVDDGKYYGQPATFDVVSVAGPRQEPVASGGFAEDGGPELGAAEAADAQFIAAARELVPQLLAEVEAAHRFERSVAVDSARLAAVEALVTDAECSVGWLSHADADWRVKAVRACDLRVALAAAADAPQPDPPPMSAAEAIRSLRLAAGPSPAVLPEKERER